MLDHANILKIYEFYDTAENYYIVTEIFPGEELFDFILKYFCLYLEKKNFLSRMPPKF